MSRPVRNRMILQPPIMAGFKPFGTPMFELEIIKLQFDEYESINLVNYQQMEQAAAAEKMGVSRPTFTRIYNNALRKIAIAFVECKAIGIEGGSVAFQKDWYKCNKCFKLIDGIQNHIKCENCTSFGNKELTKIDNIISTNFNK